MVRLESCRTGSVSERTSRGMPRHSQSMHDICALAGSSSETGDRNAGSVTPLGDDIAQRLDAFGDDGMDQGIAAMLLNERVDHLAPMRSRFAPQSPRDRLWMDGFLRQ